MRKGVGTEKGGGIERAILIGQGLDGGGNVGAGDAGTQGA